MSYYYKDASYYHYSEPVYCDDTPPDPVYYDNFPSETIYYNNTLPDHVYEDDSPSEPAHYDDTSAYDDSHLDNVTTWSSPLPPMSYEVEDELELEAYAEAAVNRSYSEDEIHPAYRDNLVTEPIYDDNSSYSEDDVHPAYRNHPTNDNHEELPTPEHHWEEYT
jgi:hypothetical protein